MKLLKNGCLAAAILSTSFSTLCLADDAMPKFSCTLSDQISSKDEIGTAKDTFTPGTAMIYYYCDSENVKKGENLTGAWVADDTHNVVPNNYKIADKSYKVEQDLTEGQVFTGRFSISKPTKGWPVGSYHVDLYVDGQLASSAKFSVK